MSAPPGFGCAAQAEASIVVSTFQAELSHAPAQLAVMTMALVRDTLLAAGAERLRDACCRPRWTVPIADLKERLKFILGLKS